MRTVVMALGALLLLAGCCCRPACPSQPSTASAAPSSTPAPEPATPMPGPAPLAQAPGAPREPVLAGKPPAPAPGADAKRLRIVLHTAKSLTMSGTAQVTLSNATSLTLDLYVDGGYGCRALRNLMCTTHVSPGTRTLEARGPNGESASTTAVVDAGDSVTWTVTEE